VEGQTLNCMIPQGGLSLEKFLDLATQLADAVAAAHGKGIIHRDLKPGNIVLTKSGAKLLDFGLAKSAGMSAAAIGAPLLSAAMTMTSPSPQLSPLTTQGTIVGTIQYMSPEQIEGKDADARSDIFALGAVLYEMATATRPFEGKSQLSVATAILEKDPEPIASRCPAAPEQLERIVATCLAKDPEQRFSSAHDVKLELQWLGTAMATAKPVASPQPAAPSRRFFATAIAVVILFALLAGVAGFWVAHAPRPQAIHAVLPTPDKMTLEATGDLGGPVAISPDGSAIAFCAHTGEGQRTLWVRSLSDDAPRQLEGTEGAIFPFWSADSHSIGFFANGKLNRISATGGPVMVLADAPGPRGGSWSKDDVILFEADTQSALLQVSAHGGAVSPATVLDGSKHTTHRWPWFLPDGKHFLFLATNHNGGLREQNGIYLGSLESKETRLVMPSDSSAEFAGGYLLYHAQSALMAQRFDPSSGKFSGDPTVVVDKITHDPGVWRTIFSVSSNGILAYQSGAASLGSELVWMDRSGKELGHLGQRGNYASMSISPDGRRVLTAMGDPKTDLWLFDLTRGGTLSRLTFETGSTDNPSWSPDGKLALYNVFATGTGSNAVTASGASAIHAKNVDGSGASRVLFSEASEVGKARASALAPVLLKDGKTLLYLRQTDAYGISIYSVPVSGESKAVKLIAPSSAQGSILNFQPSPDNRWIAYSSNESGRYEVYVVPYPDVTAGKWQVSSNGAQAPGWRGDSKELYVFTLDQRLYAVPFDGAGSQPQIGAPQPLFAIPNTAFNEFYNAAPDGKRFLVNRTPEQGSTPISLLINWPEELKK